MNVAGAEPIKNKTSSGVYLLQRQGSSILIQETHRYGVAE